MLSDEQISENRVQILEVDDSNDEFTDDIVRFDELLERNAPGNYLCTVCIVHVIFSLQYQWLHNFLLYLYSKFVFIIIHFISTIVNCTVCT